MVVSERQFRPAADLTPQFLVGGGLLASVTLVYMLATSTTFIDAVLPERLLEGLLLGVPAIGLTYTGYWLHRYDFASEQLRQVGRYALAATLVAEAVTGLALLLFPVGFLSYRETFFMFVSTGTEGALLGVLVGVFVVTDGLRRRGRELELRSEQFQYVERVADIGFWELDATAEGRDGLVLSGGASRLFDLSPGERVDLEGYVGLYHPEDRERVRAAVEGALDRDEPYDFEARIGAGDTDDRWVYTSGQPVRRGGAVVGVRGVIQDVTERKEHQRELERKNDRLERFASVVSHDLRNPLNVAEARLELAREECESENLDTVARAHDRMERLIGDVLTLAREGQAVESEPVALSTAARRCWRTVETGEAVLRNETERTVEADPDSLERLLENLFRNAVEHGGRDVTVTVDDCDDGFYVADDGPGIPPEERERAFEMGHSTTTDGTGFGLSIVEEVANAHGWDVGADESVTGGLRVEVSGVDEVATVRSG